MNEFLANTIRKAFFPRGVSLRGVIELPVERGPMYGDFVRKTRHTSSLHSIRWIRRDRSGEHIVGRFHGVVLPERRVSSSSRGCLNNGFPQTPLRAYLGQIARSRRSCERQGHENTNRADFWNTSGTAKGRKRWQRGSGYHALGVVFTAETLFSGLWNIHVIPPKRIDARGRALNTISHAARYRLHESTYVQSFARYMERQGKILFTWKRERESVCVSHHMTCSGPSRHVWLFYSAASRFYKPLCISRSRF